MQLLGTSRPPAPPPDDSETWSNRSWPGISPARPFLPAAMRGSSAEPPPAKLIALPGGNKQAGSPVPREAELNNKSFPPSAAPTFAESQSAAPSEQSQPDIRDMPRALPPAAPDAIATPRTTDPSASFQTDEDGGARASQGAAPKAVSTPASLPPTPVEDKTAARPERRHAGAPDARPGILQAAREASERVPPVRSSEPVANDEDAGAHASQALTPKTGPFPQKARPTPAQATSAVLSQQRPAGTHDVQRPIPPATREASEKSSPARLSEVVPNDEDASNRVLQDVAPKTERFPQKARPMPARDVGAGLSQQRNAPAHNVPRAVPLAELNSSEVYPAVESRPRFPNGSLAMTNADTTRKPSEVSPVRNDARAGPATGAASASPPRHAIAEQSAGRLLIAEPVIWPLLAHIQSPAMQDSGKQQAGSGFALFPEDRPAAGPRKSGEVNDAPSEFPDVPDRAAESRQPEMRHHTAGQGMAGVGLTLAHQADPKLVAPLALPQQAFASTRSASPLPDRAIISQIATAIREARPAPQPEPTVPATRSFKLVLKPEGAGSVHLTLRFSRDRLAVTIAAPSPQALAILQRDQEVLSQLLSQAGGGQFTPSIDMVSDAQQQFAGDTPQQEAGTGFGAQERPAGDRPAQPGAAERQNQETNSHAPDAVSQPARSAAGGVYL